jgi:LysM repeat protein
MRTIAINWLLAGLHQALFTALVVIGIALLLVGPVNAAPVEEDIPQSAPPRHLKAHPQPSAESAPAATTPSASVTPSDESASPPLRTGTDRLDAAPALANPAAVHKFFPYTIRSGDTLETIANTFGVQVADITRTNRRIADGDLMAGETIRIPNPFVTRESELNAEVERLSIDKQEAERKADQATNALASLHAQLETAAASNEHYERDLHSLPWWRTAAWAAAIAGVVMFGMMIASLIEWWNLRSRYRAVAEMNDSLRRLDYRYRMALAKAELRLQQLYGRRRRGFEDGQERPKLPEEAEIELLDLQIKEILESYLERLGPPSNRVRRARWRESIGAVGAPIEARTLRR